MPDELKPKLKYIEDPRRCCKECGGEMHWCSDAKQSQYTWGSGALYRGCIARGAGAHQSDGDSFICLFCDITEAVNA